MCKSPVVTYLHMNDGIESNVIASSEREAGMDTAQMQTSLRVGHQRRVRNDDNLSHEG